MAGIECVDSTLEGLNQNCSFSVENGYVFFALRKVILAEKFGNLIVGGFEGMMMDFVVVLYSGCLESKGER